jgi:ATP-dependent Lon protease
MTASMSPGASIIVIPDALPLLPTQGTIVFPDTVSPIVIGQERSIRLVDDAMRANRLLGLVAQLTDELVASDALPRLGTAAFVHQLFQAPDGTIRLLLQGVARMRVRDFLKTDPYLVARVERAPEIEPSGLEIEALARTVREIFVHLLSLTTGASSELSNMVAGISGPRELAYLVASSSPLALVDKQEILELDSVTTKLRRLVELIRHEIAVRELERDISSQTQEKMSKAQRDYMLREQLKTIQQQLGEEDPEHAEARELRERVAETNLPQEIRHEVERELDRFERLPGASAEQGVIRTYIDWIVNLPWKKFTGGPIEVARARQVLDEDHYDLEEIKDRIVEHLAVKRLRAVRGRESEEFGHEPILCLVGPPGVGKTSLGQSIARAMGRRFVRMSLGGVHDEAEIRGHRRTYIGAMPGRVIQALRRADAADPIIMLDEVDKLGVGFQGDPAAALLELLDPAQNHAFVDTYLGVPFDLSQIMFVCTANTTETLAPVLLDRLEVLRLSGYTETDKLHIAQRYLLPQLLRENGLLEDEIAVEDEAIRTIIREYTREAGVRGMSRELSSILRRAARRVSEGEPSPLVIDAARVRQYLGKARFYSEVPERTDRPGVATGLAWTPVGGDLLFVEATMMNSSEERLILTGMLGEVMRESAQAALSYLRSANGKVGIDPTAFDQKSIHLHVPAGAIPKDGPSAGATMLAALASLALGRPAKNDTATTGEITLRGKILPVGGIREKVLAAHRAGLHTVVLPRHNERDLEEVPLEIRESMRFMLVDSAEDVLRAALS